MKTITSEDIHNEMIDGLELIFGKDFNLEKSKISELEDANKEVKKKASILKRLGFKNTPTAKNVETLDIQIAEKEDKIKLSQKEIELTNKYRIEYPGYKFIPDSVFDQVCEKYDLYTALPERYIKEIPNKNLEEIDNFIQKYGIVYQKIFNPHWNVLGTTAVIEESSTAIYLNELEECGSMAGYYSIKETPKIEITAPIDHYDLKNSEIKNRKINTKVDDPIVTRIVEGGRVVISCWDKEADIPEIKNQEWN